MKLYKPFYWLAVLTPLLFVACSPSGKDKSKQIEQSLEVQLDTTSKMVKFENTLFSVPSPYQLSLLIKQVGGSFNSEMINSSEHYGNYTSLFKKSVNLGIYGADLAYLNIYEQLPLSITYFSVVKNMANDLGLSAAFSENLIKRIESNMGRQDSLLYILSNTYRDVDVFLKDNQRQREGALVLAGGWVEGMYFLSKLALETNNQLLIQRIGENKQPLENVVKILSPYYSESEAVGQLVDDLIDLSYEFDAIERSYEFVEPVTTAETRTTKIRSKTTVKVLPEVLHKIDAKIEKIRKSLIS